MYVHIYVFYANCFVTFYNSSLVVVGRKLFPFFVWKHLVSFACLHYDLNHVQLKLITVYIYSYFKYLSISAFHNKSSTTPSVNETKNLVNRHLLNQIRYRVNSYFIADNTTTDLCTYFFIMEWKTFD